MRFGTSMLTILVVAVLTASAVTPERVPYMSEADRSTKWYRQQAKAWRSVTRKRPSDPQAWRNLYFATRYVYKKAGTVYEEPQKAELVAILGQMRKYVPASYEYYECVLWDPQILPPTDRFVEQALILHGDSLSIMSSAMCYYERTVQPDRFRATARKVYESDWSESWAYDHAYNLLHTPRTNAILLVDGDIAMNASILQSVLGIRPDVTVLHCFFMERDEHYLPRKLVVRGYSGIEYECADGDRGAATRKVFAAMREQHPEKPIYAAVWVSRRRLPPYEELYLTGLAFRWSPKPVDNLFELRHNIEDVYRLDYVWNDWHNTHPWYPNACMNYTAGLLDLARHYHATGNENRVKDLTDLLVVILRRGGHIGDVEKSIREAIGGK